MCVILFVDITRKQLREGVLPTLNLPQKSCTTSSTSITQRSTSSILKRELSLTDHQPMDIDIGKACYNSFGEFSKRIGKLKLLPSWKILEEESHVKIIKENEQFLLPTFEIFVNFDLEITVRCYGWVVPKNCPILMSNNCSFKNVTLSNFIMALDEYHICNGMIIKNIN